MRDAPWRKLGAGKCCDDNDAFARVYNNLLIHLLLYTSALLTCCLPFFLHCVSDNIPDVFSYNSRKHCKIFIIFDRNITEKVGNQKMLYFPTSSN